MVVAAEGVPWDLLAAGVDMGEGAMIEEGLIVAMHLEVDIVEDIEVDLGAMPRTERSKRWLDNRWHHKITEGREESKHPHNHQSRRRCSLLSVEKRSRS